MKNNNQRLQVRIPSGLKEELENVVKQNVGGMTNSKSLMVSIALILLFNQMETTPIDEIYVKTYIPFLKPNGDD